MIDDWADGRIDKAYPAECYRQALASAHEDALAYSSLPADLRAALLNARAGIVPAGQLGKAGSAKYERTVLDQRRLVPLSTDIHHRDDDVLFEAAPAFRGTAAVVERSTLNLPLPLVILAVIALLLLAAGAVGMVTRRGQQPGSR